VNLRERVLGSFLAGVMVRRGLKAFKMFSRGWMWRGYNFSSETVEGNFSRVKSIPSKERTWCNFPEQRGCFLRFKIS
jgi:hypothetical protein